MKRILYFISLVITIAACKQAKEERSEADFTSETDLDRNQKEWVENTLSELSIREMAGQTIMDWFSGSYVPTESQAFDQEVKLIESGLGGIWFMGGSPVEVAARANALQKHARVPLLVTGFESLGKKFLELAEARRWARGGGTDLPPALAYGAIGDPGILKQSAKINGMEMLATGNHIGNPECGVLVNLANVLHNRCFGDDPTQVAELTSAYITGLHETGVLAITSFFPGSGNVDKDPHIELPIMEDDRHSFDSVHFVPLIAAIEAGTDMFMSTHIAVPGLSGSDSIPATLSPEVCNILRKEMGYDGVLMTDAMAMGGITNHYEFTEAAVLAFKAGHDIILGPSPFKYADTLAYLVENGEIPLSQLRASVRRILRLKAKLGLHKNAMVNLDQVNTIVGHRDHQKLADSAASLSIVLLRDHQQNVPVDVSGTKKVLSISYDHDNPFSKLHSHGFEFNRTLRRHIGTVSSVNITENSLPSVYEQLLSRSKNADLVILSIYLRPELGTKVQDEISEPLIQFMKSLHKEGKEVIVLSFGELEVLNVMPDVGTFLMAWSGQDVMQRAAAKALLGIKPISGQLPINLLPFHRRGDGLHRVNTQ